MTGKSRLILGNYQNKFTKFARFQILYQYSIEKNFARLLQNLVRNGFSRYLVQTVLF